MTAWEPISFEDIRSYPLKERSSKVKVDDFSNPWKPGGKMGHWINSLPDILAGKDFRKVVNHIIEAVKSEKMVILGMGAHPIKVGLTPVIIDLMERGIIHGLAMNGAGIIHDAELAMIGQTSEDVAAQLGEGRFGMAEETGRLLNEAIIVGVKNGYGLGRSIGAMLIREKFPYNSFSLLARAVEMNIPVTVHVALGTDIIHFHPTADGAAIGQASHLDFRIFANLVSRLEGGVYINLGSAVILPEVFLKAITVVRNLGHPLKQFTTLNMDFIKGYRPMTNVVHRPTQEGGKGFFLTGHHEIMLPLLAAAVIEALQEN
jgi:hypothetical protein